MNYVSLNLLFCLILSSVLFMIQESIYFRVHFLIDSSERPSTTYEQLSTTKLTAGKRLMCGCQLVACRHICL